MIGWCVNRNFVVYWEPALVEVEGMSICRQKKYVFHNIFVL